MNKVLEEIKKIGIVPVVVLDDAKDAEPLAKALCEGGLPCAEVTFRTEAAEESIHIISEKYPEMLVGAGTVLTTEQVDRAVAAGASLNINSPNVTTFFAIFIHPPKFFLIINRGFSLPMRLHQRSFSESHQIYRLLPNHLLPSSFRRMLKYGHTQGTLLHCSN